LALVKSIAERHGGQVTCQARLGGGACFVVTLPAVV
jgi:signal transduction histidine kinase